MTLIIERFEETVLRVPGTFAIRTKLQSCLHVSQVSAREENCSKLARYMPALFDPFRKCIHLI